MKLKPTQKGTKGSRTSKPNSRGEKMSPERAEKNPKKAMKGFRKKASK